MTPKKGYVWFVTDRYTKRWWNTELKRHGVKENIPCTAEEMKQAVHGVFVLNTLHFGQLNQVAMGNVTVKQWMDYYIVRLKALSRRTKGLGSWVSTLIYPQKGSFDSILP